MGPAVQAARLQHAGRRHRPRHSDGRREGDPPVRGRESMTFKIGVTRGLLMARGEPCFNPRAFEVLKANKDIAWEWIPEDLREITPDVAARYDSLLVNLSRVTRASVARADCRLKIVARNGVGFDTVDVPALTAKGIVLTNTPLAVPAPRGGGGAPPAITPARGA